MYLHKVEGPRSVTLPDGTVLSRNDLPPAETTRWVASRKVIVVRSVLYGLYGLISLSDAKKRYGLSDEEFNSWVSAVAEHGADALKVTALKKYRQPKDECE
ncbi:DUF1153 domain-containing protein [Ruegeria sp. A3M17]|uniref:CtrA inhibitor SciP n=1 Tax=Ruegeria sp. A3M17 TaxID=2267229 RepID=UPI000DE8DB68|nr:DUF1153 domain-containing protein [Ruegeria sp. A3M17]RBW56021.1 DUF1153 domain-containing protein [Ruegeria sp. A3M17]